MNTILLKPGAVTLAQWRALYRGAPARLDPACAPRIAESAAAVARASSPRARRSMGSTPALGNWRACGSAMTISQRKEGLGFRV